MIRRALVAAVVLLAIARPGAAGAAGYATVRGGSVAFFADTLRVFVRGGAVLRTNGGTTLTGAAATIDLRTDRALVTGNARLVRNGEDVSADAIAYDQRTGRVDVLDMSTGVARVDRSGVRTPAPDDADAFTFPDVDDRHAYIRSRTAEIVSRTSIRFLPATFPTSVGAAPVPMYLYTFAVSNGFATTSLQSAAFDQPYGLFSSPNALTSLHFRWLNGIGPSLGVQENLIGSADGFIAASADIPARAATQYAMDAYRRLGDLSTVSVNALAEPGFSQASVGLTRALGFVTGRLNYTVNSTGYETALASVRTHDRPLFAGITWHAIVSGGLSAQPGGVLPQLPDSSHYTTLWQHGAELFAASPLVHGPLRTTLSATIDDSLTWYSFPHHYDALSATVSASRRFSRVYTAFLGYSAQWSADVYPGDETLFYAPIAVPLPDGTLYYGYEAYDGFATYRQASIALQYTPNPTTLARLSYGYTNDFPQFDGFGRPPYSVSAFVQFRPAPNFGIALGRSYDFGWGGTHWVPTWTFSILP